MVVVATKNQKEKYQSLTRIFRYSYLFLKKLGYLANQPTHVAWASGNFMIGDAELQRRFQLVHLGRGPNGQQPIKMINN